MSLPKYLQVAARIRAQVASGVLLPGAPVPSGAALSRATGYSTLTCRRALRTLIDDGVLVPGVSRNARPRVGPLAPVPWHRTLADSARTLSKSLAARRRLAGLTQPEFAKLVGVSVTTVGHAETGRYPGFSRSTIAFSQAGLSRVRARDEKVKRGSDEG